MANFITENITYMNTKYTLKNFRVFDEQGATFELAPLTILTGCNSSGKSSMTKSIMLLSPLMSKYKEDIQAGRFGGFSGTGFSSYNLDFTRGKHKLGSLEKVINWNGQQNTFSVTYSVFSYALLESVDVTLTFGKFSSDKNNQTLHAQLQKIEVSHEGRIFYQYKCADPNAKIIGFNNKEISIPFAKEDAAHVNLADWKNKLINGLHLLELGYTIECIQGDIQALEEGYGYDAKFQYGAWDSLLEFYGEDFINNVLTIYHSLEKRLPIHVKELCKNFNFDNLKKIDGGRIDWEKSEQKFEFPYHHLYSLRKLMDDLNSVSKDQIIQYAENRFVNAENIKNEWYNNDVYKQWIHDIFAAYIDSNYDNFSDFYANYENEDLKNEFVYFGTKGGHTRTLSEGSYIDLFAGTANPVENRLFGSPFKEGKAWKDMSKREQFKCIFWCLQGFAKYENLSTVYGIPEPSLQLIDILREYATLACAELFANCDFLTETDFIEIDRSNAQRIYSFTAQGTDFNQTIDMYYNADDTVYYDYDYNHLNGKTYQKGSFAQKWLKELTGLDGFRLEQAPEGVGYYVFLQKNMPSGEAIDVSLADVGYGVTPLLSMLLRMELVLGSHLDNPGYATIFIEEPESNLHPKVQSRLAEIFADAVENYPIHVVVETHSEYLIRKLQVLVAEKMIQPEKIALHYLYSPDNELREEDEKAEPQVKLINILSDGSLSDSFGSGFFDEATKRYQDLMRN